MVEKSSLLCGRMIFTLVSFVSGVTCLHGRHIEKFIFSEAIDLIDNKLGKVGTIVTGASIATFAIAMLVGLASGLNTSFMSYFVGIFIAIGYIMFTAALVVSNKNRTLSASGLAGLAFSVVYAVLILIAYYAMLTTVRMNGALSNETLSIISYEHLGSLFFNYDLLGYGFMGLSTFFIGFTIIPKKQSDKALRLLLWIHGIFSVSCFLMPMFPVFTADMTGGDVIGTLILLVWCAYFLPICILGYRYFKEISEQDSQG